MSADPDGDVVPCGVCGDVVSEAADVACERCSAPHHPDCWSFNQGCSVFGCGGQSQVAFASRVEDLRARGLTITEATRAPAWNPRGALEGLRRRFWSRLPFLVRTVPAGLIGSLVALKISMWLGASPIHKTPITIGMVLAGVAYGALAPFLAPWMIRRPERLGAAAFFTSMGSFVVVAAFEIRGGLGIPLWTLCLAAALTFAACVSEVVAGYRTRTGQALGRWGGLVRGAVAWLAVAFSILTLAAIEDGRYDLDPELLTIAMSMGLMGCAVAVPAMEQGKNAFLEAVGAPRLPSRS